jgi:hypothetical protein
MSDPGYCVMLQSRFAENPHVTLLWFSFSESQEALDPDRVVKRVIDGMEDVARQVRDFPLVVKGREEFAEHTMVTLLAMNRQLKLARVILDRSIRVSNDDHGPYWPGVTPSVHPFRPHVSDWDDAADDGGKRAWSNEFGAHPRLDTLVLSRDREIIWAASL